MECPSYSELPEHRRPRRVLPDAKFLGRCAAAQAVGHAVQQFIQQGQVRKYRLDDQWTTRRPQSGLYGSVSGAQREPDTGLHELCAWCVCGLLPVSWRRAGEWIGFEVLFAEHHMERDGTQFPSES